MHDSKVKMQLNKWYTTYHKPEYLNIDPLVCVRTLQTQKDREVGALIAAVIAYGKVEIIIDHCEWLFSVMEWRPADFVVSTSLQEKRALFKGFKHRFNDADDIILLLETLASILATNGSLEMFFLSGFNVGDSSVKSALSTFSESVKAVACKISKNSSGSFNYFFPSPQAGSACKRLNMFLRWVVRKDDSIDLGLWGTIKPSALIIPVDTHIAHQARELGLTNRKSADWKMAEEITAALRTIDNHDPVRFDFSICRAGMDRERRSVSARARLPAR